MAVVVAGRGRGGRGRSVYISGASVSQLCVSFNQSVNQSHAVVFLPLGFIQ